MSKSLTEELAELKLGMLRMMNLSRAALQKAVRSIHERDESLAAQVVDEDSSIDALECELDHLNLRLLALAHPYAKDLRYIVGAMRMTVDIERIGDEAVNIAERSLLLLQRQPMPPYPLLDDFFALSQDMLTQAITAFTSLDSLLANRLCERNKLAADLNMRIFRDMTKYMIDESRTVERAVQIIFIGHALRRVCCGATNLAESVVFMDQGVSIKHCDETPAGGVGPCGSAN